MKQVICAFLMSTFALAVLAPPLAAQTDTVYIYKSDRTERVITNTTKVSENFPGFKVSHDLFSKTETADLFAGKTVPKEDIWWIKIISGRFLNWGYEDAVEQTTYAVKDGYIQALGEPKVITRDGDDPFLGILHCAIWYLWPLGLLFSAFLAEDKDEQGEKQTRLFTIFTSLALFLSALAGWLFGCIVGGIFGFWLSFLTLIISQGSDDKKKWRRKPLSLFGSSLLACIITGILGGAVGQAKLGILSPEFMTILRYPIIYGGAGIIAIIWRGLIDHPIPNIKPIGPLDQLHEI